MNEQFQGPFGFSNNATVWVAGVAVVDVAVLGVSWDVTVVDAVVVVVVDVAVVDAVVVVVVDVAVVDGVGVLSAFGRGDSLIVPQKP